MGSEGYFINQFIVKKTNQRTDEWGGSYANRTKLPVEIVKAVRQAVGKDFIIIYRQAKSLPPHCNTALGFQPLIHITT
jgi:2,4-dienoyl-CoA reductase (NADPH2)